MDLAKAESVVKDLQTITKIIFTGEVTDFKPTATLLEKRLKPSDTPFIKKDASGRAFYYIIEGKAGVDIGQPDRIILGNKNTLGEMSMISQILNIFGKCSAQESRNADVYCEDDIRLITFNYAPIVEILQANEPEYRKFFHQIMISLNRIMFRKLIGVNESYINLMLSLNMTGVQQEELNYPSGLTEGITRFVKKMDNIPNLRVSSHDMRGVLIREKEPNTSIIFIEKGKVKISTLVMDDEAEEEFRVDLDVHEAPMIVGESSILNLGAISSAQVEVLGSAKGFRMTIQNLLRHLQRYPDLFRDFFRLILEINYYRTISMMKRLSELDVVESQEEESD